MTAAAIQHLVCRACSAPFDSYLTSPDKFSPGSLDSWILIITNSMDFLISSALTSEHGSICVVSCCWASIESWIAQTSPV